VAGSGLHQEAHIQTHPATNITFTLKNFKNNLTHSLKPFDYSGLLAI
jgi:hypothetical protein